MPPDSKIFIDTQYLIGRSIKSDQWHDACSKAEEALPENVLLMTTEYILAEFLAATSMQGEAVRRMAVELARSYLSDSKSYKVLSGSVKNSSARGSLFDQGLDLYEARGDKRYSLVDYISFVVMRDEDIHYALTNDHHFEQEGFETLIK